MFFATLAKPAGFLGKENMRILTKEDTGKDRSLMVAANNSDEKLSSEKVWRCEVFFLISDLN